MFKYIYVLIFFFNIFITMAEAIEKPFHHITDDKGNTISFRNPEGSPERDSSFNWSFKVFNEEKRKLNMDIPLDHVINKKDVLELIDELNILDLVAVNSKNKSIVFTGTLKELSRDEAKELAKKFGLKVLSSVSNNLNYIVAGEKAGTKLKNAKSLNIKILSEKEFINMVKNNSNY